MATMNHNNVFESGSQITLPVPDIESLSDSDGSSVWSKTPDLSLARPSRAFFSSLRQSFRQSQFYSPRTLEEGRCPTAQASSETLVEKSNFHEKPLPAVPERNPLRDIELGPIPQKKGFRLYRYLRWNFGSVYKRIFTLAFIGNMSALAVLIAQSSFGGSRLTYNGASIAVASNLLLAMLVRNEHVVNAMFVVFGTWPKRLPLFWRHLFAKVYSYGGIHSGCSVAATFWYIAFLVLLSKGYLSSELSMLQGYILLVSYSIIALLVFIIIFAHPALRVRMHNWFEGIHRYMGWSVVILFWAQVLLMVGETSTETHTTYGKALVMSPVFWILVCITLLVIYPWIRLHVRDVEVEKLSPHCVKLNFNYANVQYGQAIRLTDAPLRETHGFAVIPNPVAPKPEFVCSRCRSFSESPSDSGETITSGKNFTSGIGSQSQGLSNTGKKGFSVIVSKAGDWTQKIIDHPPSKLYTRGIPQFGVLRVAGMFEPVLIIATGSGIAPCMSLFVQKPDHPVRIIWSTPDPEKTYGQAVIDTIYKADPHALIIDTKKTGRPDLVRIAYRVWESSKWEGRREFTLGRSSSFRESGDRRKPLGQCEAAVIISNARVTRKVVYGLESRGVRAYGAIFDS